MTKYFFLFFFSLSLGVYSLSAQDWETPFEMSKGRQTFTYSEGIAYFQKLADSFPQIQMKSYGESDSGFPLHLLIYSSSQEFEPLELKRAGKNVFMINNAIHPGEPDGVEASAQLFRNLAQGKESLDVENTVIIAIPFYNIGGALNRNSFSRVNQNGPQAYGFRGNAQNLDLNRDFIKADSKNAQSFMEIFQEWQPDVFLDTHVSNGADYQYTMTYLATQADKLGGELGDYLRKDMIPSLEKSMEAKSFPMVPYVNVFGRTPEPNGYQQFYDSPRYTSGYTTLFQTLGFISETHMLKAFPQRVAATYALMRSILELMAEDGADIRVMKENQQKAIAKQKEFGLDWKVRRDTSRPLLFKGYEASRIPSAVTSGERLKYDRNKPFEKTIPFYEFYEISKQVQKPFAYIIPQSWTKVIQLLRVNQVELSRLSVDQEVEVQAYYIETFDTRKNPYESHYLHYNTTVRKEDQKIMFRAGDYVVYPNQVTNRYILETLEPEAPDSFFNWNFFDIILQQKEGYSAYVFEDLAEEILNQDADLKKRFDEKKEEDELFANDSNWQLYFIYQNSIYMEKEYLRYPIFRLEKDRPLK